MVKQCDVNESKKILLVEDHPVTRYGIASLLTAEEDMEVCCQFSGGRGLLDKIQRTTPNAIILDLSLGDENGLELVKDIKSFSPEIPVLVYSMHDEDVYAERVLKAGGNGYVEKSEPPAVLIEALRAVLSGDIWLTASCSKKLINQMQGHNDMSRVGIDSLSDRELQVFELEGKGRSTREIADSICLSPKTIESYKKKIKDKLGLKNHIELRCKAIQWVMDEC